MKIGEQFKAIASNAGVSVSRAVLLGRFFHVDFTVRTDERKVRELLGAMKATQIRFLSAGVDGKHMDGSACHRICAIF